MSGHDVARQTGFSAGNISRWENGRREIGIVDAATYLATCGVDLAERNRLLDLTEPPSELYWVRPYFHKLADALKSVIIQESIANSLVGYQPLLIPGLLQTEDYARALWDGLLHPKELEVLVTARMDRQKALDRRDPLCGTFFVHERAVRSVVGGPEVMHEQILHLLLASAVPTCVLRVVPEASDACSSLCAPFNILGFAEHSAIVNTEVYGATIFLDDRLCVDAYYALVARLEHNALNEGQSRDLLSRLAGERDRMEE
ncbi:helix-turn-helix transcriptional regulator [Amycolatopsis minnesotensis]|uniref:Helix-turn-helix transcriptional regulator n=2 Tax=Amycolatopsis minnesotensis TaxID=337894 RepID=A0ABN2QJL1_9PSEU